MLVNTNYVYFILPRNGDKLVNFILIDSKFASRAACYHMMGSTSTHFRIYPNKYSFTL